MGHFAAALKSVLIEMGWSQSDLVRETGAMAQSRLSLYLSTNDLPRPGTLEQICKVLPERLRRDLTAAYLTDQIPASVSEAVAVTTVQEGNTPEAKYRANKAPPGSLLRRDLDVLERRALKDPNLAKALNYLAASLEGVEPEPAYFASDTLENWSVQEDPAVIAAKKELDQEPGSSLKRKGRKKN